LKINSDNGQFTSKNELDSHSNSKNSNFYYSNTFNILIDSFNQIIGKTITMFEEKIKSRKKYFEIIILMIHM